MSLASIFAAFEASCVHVPQYHVNVVEVDKYQLKGFESVTKTFIPLRFNPVTLVADWSAAPVVMTLDFLESPDIEPITDPVVHVSGFVAACQQPGTALGCSRWYWIHSLGWSISGHAATPLDLLHLQHAGTNANAVCLVRYPLVPPA